MATYLIKVTLIWAILLALYELLYRKSPAYTLNRICLLGTLVAGILLPLIPASLPGHTGTSYSIGQVNKGLQSFGQAVTPAAPAPATSPGTGTILFWLYLSGVLVFLVLSLREIVLILRTAIYGHYITIGPYKIFSSNKSHAPFSFMGWVFISDPSLYDEKGLEYIFRHEEAHNRRWHWLDMILVQSFFVLFWFHPLVWRARYLLKLNHEYEADYYAAGSNAYEYGHFLLQQTLLKGTPAIAHSFHFSPIKNRIHMLTKIRKKLIRRYTAVIPMLLCCTLLFAKSGTNNQRIRAGNKIVFQGHEFLWNEGAIDTIMIEHPATGEIMMKAVRQEGYVSRMDGDTVYANEEPFITQAQFRYLDKNFYSYFTELFRKQIPEIADSIEVIMLKNIVIDETGKLSYYDMAYQGNSGIYDLGQPQSPLPAYAKAIETIMSESPEWLPGLISGERRVKVRISNFIVYLKQSR